MNEGLPPGCCRSCGLALADYPQGCCRSRQRELGIRPQPGADPPRPAPKPEARHACDAAAQRGYVIAVRWHEWVLDTDEIDIAISFCPFCGLRLDTDAQ